MALHRTPLEHDENGPETWQVVKVAERAWQLRDRAGTTMEQYSSKKDAEEAKRSGPLFDLYEKEGRWFAGEAIDHWRPYAELVSEAGETDVVTLLIVVVGVLFAALYWPLAMVLVG